MDSKQFEHAYGHRCHAVVKCHACGRSHEMTGTLTPGPMIGDVALDGRIVPISDVVSLVPETQMTVSTGPALLRSLLPYAWLVWALLAVLQVLAQR